VALRKFIANSKKRKFVAGALLVVEIEIEMIFLIPHPFKYKL
jgi:hypothetical protein